MSVEEWVQVQTIDEILTLRQLGCEVRKKEMSQTISFFARATDLAAARAMIACLGRPVLPAAQGFVIGGD